MLILEWVFDMNCFELKFINVIFYSEVVFKLLYYFVEFKKNYYDLRLNIKYRLYVLVN